jgi:hypothetical protein
MESELPSLCHPERSLRSRRTPDSGFVRTDSSIRASSGALLSSCHPERSEGSRAYRRVLPALPIATSRRGHTQSTAPGIWNSDPHPTHRRRYVGLSLTGRGYYALAREILRCAQDDTKIGERCSACASSQVCARGRNPGSFDSADSAQDDTKIARRGRLSMRAPQSSYCQ